MRVLFADKLPDRARTRLAASGLEVVAEATLTAPDVASSRLDPQPDLLIVRSMKVDATQLAADLGSRFSGIDDVHASIVPILE